MGTLPERIGKFEVLSLIGRGAMGVVYKARDPYIGRLVALKRISLSDMIPEDQKAEFKERFFIEARAAGGLRHPNIVTIHDVDEADGAPFMAMEFVEGGSLSKLMKERGALPLEEAVAIVRQVALGLAYAHQRGVVHRDIKPDNILVEQGGRVVITDFGAAHLLTSELTRTGEVLGTPHYMSPEQILGDPVDGRSDLFSLGVVFYLLLTGRRPFKGDTVSAVCYHIVHSPVEPLPQDLRLTAVAAPVLERLLAKDRAQRYRTGLELVEALNALDSSAGEPEAPLPASNSLEETFSVSTPVPTVRTESPAVSNAAPPEPETSPRGGLLLALGLGGGAFVVLVLILVGGLLAWRLLRRAAPSDGSAAPPAAVSSATEPSSSSPSSSPPDASASGQTPPAGMAPGGDAAAPPSKSAAGPGAQSPAQPKPAPKTPARAEPLRPSPEMVEATAALDREAQQAIALGEHRRFGRAFASIDDLKRRLDALKTSATPGDEAALLRSDEAIGRADEKVRGELAAASRPLLDQGSAAVARASAGRSPDVEAIVRAYAEAYPVVRWRDRLPTDMRLSVEEFMRQCHDAIGERGWARAHALAQGKAFPGQD